MYVFHSFMRIIKNMFARALCPSSKKKEITAISIPLPIRGNYLYTIRKLYNMIIILN